MSKNHIRKNLLIAALKNPASMKNLSIAEWNILLFDAHAAGLRGRLGEDILANGLWEEMPQKVRQIFESSMVDAKAGQRKIMWELNRIRRALYGFDGKIILLKGAAYIALGLNVSRGRISADIDILVAKNRLDQVEDLMLKAGWQHHVLNEYDQRYYRLWAHELPPLKHPDRQLEVDIHHNILPQTSRLKPDIDLMIEDAVKIDKNIHCLSPQDMLLHSAVHLFHDGEIRGSIRNLLEQHDMIGEYAQEACFWQTLLSRAKALGLSRPLFYTLHYCMMFLETEIPETVLRDMKKYAPNYLTGKMMDFMVSRILLVPGAGQSTMLYYLSCKILYMRSHWLKMPPVLLLRHLTTKFFRQFGKE